MDIIWFDFSEAFDVVNNQVLLQKLPCISITGTLLNWVSPFLLQNCVCLWCQMQLQRCWEWCALRFHTGATAVFTVYKSPAIIHPEQVQNFRWWLQDLPKIQTISSLIPDTSSCQTDIDKICIITTLRGLNLNEDKCVVLRFQKGTVSREDYHLFIS